MEKAFMLLLCACFPLFGFQNLSGELFGEFERGEYLVTGAATVPEGRTLSFGPGTVVYFEQVSGLIIYGTLKINGDSGIPVRLTSVREKSDSIMEVQPEAFDWNGIEVKSQTALISLSNVKISHCVFGLKIESLKTRVVLDNVTFFNNGYSSLVRGEQNIPIEAGKPCNISWNAETEWQISENQMTPSEEQSFVKFGNKVKLSINIGGIGLLTAGLAVLTFNSLEKEKNRTDYMNQKDPYWASVYRERIRTNSKYQLFGLALSGIGAVSSGMTFFF